MITVIEQTTNERKEEIKNLFNTIKPLLDDGYNYKTALIKIGRINKNTHPARRGWFKELTDYGTEKGYKYEDYIYKKRKYDNIW